MDCFGTEKVELSSIIKTVEDNFDLSQHMDISGEMMLVGRS